MPHKIRNALGRMSALFWRFYYLMRRSPPRLIDLLYWPTLNMLVWGFLNMFLAREGLSGQPAVMAAGMLLTASILWDLVVRSQLGLMVSLMEEFWSRHMGSLLVTPLRTWEFLLALLGISAVRAAIGIVPAMLLAIPFFGISVFSLGLPLAGFVLSLLVSGWWCGLLVCGLLFRYGLAAEWFIWMALFIMSPFVCAFYPVQVLPEWLQAVAWALPPTYSFEGMRQIFLSGVSDPALMLKGFALNALYVLLGALVFLRSIEGARGRGGLLQLSE